MFDSTIESESESEADVDPVDDGGGERGTTTDAVVGPPFEFELLLLLLLPFIKRAG